MTPYEDVITSLNQLVSVIAGRDGAVATNHLSHDPSERVDQLIGLASRDLSDAAASGNQREMKQAQRKLESLMSLRIISTVLIKETDWMT